MYPSEQANAPNPDETLAQYIRRIRLSLGLSQKEVADKAGIHLQSLGKIERGHTTRLNQKPKRGLAYALGLPIEYLDAASKGVAVSTNTTLRFCPQCWTPGTTPDPMWTNLRSKYCFACGTALWDRCYGCNEPIASLKHRFCPYCGKAYRPSKVQIPVQ
uniref:Transcriptional regulator, XRE family n=1 Tax=Cyanothece sp. (strain PCC 7425 / ATCC 29141) TaxID=395961 RepID=B8HMV9_CYAP4